MVMALGVVAALLARERTGRGDLIDAAMVDGAALLTTFLHGLKASGTWRHPRGENLLDGGAPFYGTYACADGRYVAVGCVEAEFFAKMLEVMGLDAALAASQYDRDAWPHLRETIARRFQELSRDEWAERLEPTDACVTRVLELHEVTSHEHSRERKAFMDVDDVPQPSPAPRFHHGETSTPPPARRVSEIAQVLDSWSEVASSVGSASCRRSERP
ncbi:hypothetical protein GCM10009721_05430 [Terrabacter tumescens]|uniref:CoA transferase n=1 Tax=Terrabacter tumescens TaxID=60443 RepID=A0ABQ2HJI2_9MICO|nr:hypothetical protein GCM10009721_05430 [Terrabacter tumescens]